MSRNAPGIFLFRKLSCRLLILFVLTASAYGQDGQTDHSSIHPDSKAPEYLLPLFTIHGVPKNEDTDNPVTILVNHGYIVGFSKNTINRFGRPTRCQRLRGMWIRKISVLRR